LRPGRVAGLLEEERPGLVEEVLHVRVQGVEGFAQARRVERQAPFFDRLRQRCADAAPLVAEQVEQPDRGCTCTRPR
jgi:hypothetical protein